jgi:hypothetical protein
MPRVRSTWTPGTTAGTRSYFTDGGASADVATATDSAGHAGSDAGSGDASFGCGALSACCASLSASTQSLCSTVAASGNAAQCSAELVLLQGAGDCTGVTILAEQVQVPPNRIASNGTSLFWATFENSPGLSSMPVGGGPIKILLNGQTANSQGGAFLGVDDVNVYVLAGYSLLRIPKNGAPATLVNEAGATVVDATSLGSTAYWVENVGGPMPRQPVSIRSAPLLGGPVITIAAFTSAAPVLDQIGVTSTSLFVGMEAAQLFDFSMSGVPAGRPTRLDGGTPGFPGGYPCNWLTSDTDAIYCAEGTGYDLRIASDGTTAVLGQTVNSSYVVYDNTYAYWGRHDRRRHDHACAESGRGNGHGPRT